MGALTTSLNVPPAVRTFYDRMLLHRAQPYNHHGRPMDRRSIKTRNGDIIKFRRYEALGISLAPLVEGSPPAGRQMTYTDIQQQIQQWGDFIPMTDFFEMVALDRVLMEANKLLGEQAGQQIDQLNREELNAGTVVQYGGAATSRATLQTTAHLVTAADLDIAIRTLENANASYFTEILTGTTKIATQPIANAYLGICSPDVHMTLKGLAGWIDVWNYSNTGPVMPGEVGAYRNIRFLMTTSAKKFLAGGGALTDVQGVTNADVHCILIMGQHAAASIPMEGHSMENIIKPKGSAGTADPLNQVSTSGWKHTGARKRTNETFMVRLEVTVAL